MITLDTNILLRYVVKDDDVQSSVAANLIEDTLTIDNPGLITAVALVEFVWVLEDTFGIALNSIIELIQKLLLIPQICFEHESAVRLAIAVRHRDLADGLIHEVGKASGSSSTITFDKKFARLSGVELLK